MLSANKRLRSGLRSRLLLYMSGHGGDPFLKFNDQFELPAADLANAFADAFSLGRFAEVLVLIDTCQASTITAALHQPPAFWRLLTTTRKANRPLLRRSPPPKPPRIPSPTRLIRTLAWPCPTDSPIRCIPTSGSTRVVKRKEREEGGKRRGQG